MVFPLAKGGVTGAIRRYPAPDRSAQTPATAASGMSTQRDDRRQWPCRSVDGPLAVRGESFFAPGMNLAGSVRRRIGAEKRLF
jgi:hypothetical protein